jgi:hypothetical protein
MMNFRSAVFALVLCLAASSANAQQTAAAVKPVKQIDSVWNGAVIGAGAGVAGAWIFTRVNCGPRGYDKECSAIAAPLGFVLFVPGGAIAGAIIDRLINKTLPAGANAHAVIAPIVAVKDGRKSTGLAMKMTFRF